jgi:hypothetical protein|tara:strand:+ start:1971 stop:2234 length:264 start_codon:yes stop_codon:yes gene_type:complete
VAEVISGNPYVDDGNIRTFDIKRPANDYIWHRDKEDRTIKLIEGEGWQLQIEDCLPFLLNLNESIHIPQGVYHRLIKGYNTLKVEIK